MKFIEFQIKRFRSIKDLTIKIVENEPIIICGENNVGKTNILRALNIFFNYFNSPKDLFIPERDIPYNKFYGSRGGTAYTEFIGTFEKKDKTKHKISFRLQPNGEISFKLNNRNVEIGDSSIFEILDNFRYYYIKSNNINIPEILSKTLEEEGLLPLDKKRSKQTQALKKLEEFIDLSKKAILDIEKEINLKFAQLINFDGFLKGKKIKINFAEYENLREALSQMVSITFDDGIDNGIVCKGSGVQRVVLLSLMQYISSKSNKKIIWGLDEPEVFLQPKLQKQVAKIIKDITKNQNQQTIITTHSQYFIDLRNVSNTHLLVGDLVKKEYIRRRNKTFYEIEANFKKFPSISSKISEIKKHLGIANNDGWILLPYNLLIEGVTDKKYLEELCLASDIQIPNIFIAHGTSKFLGFLQYLDLSAENLDYKPTILCILDYDSAGREQFEGIKETKFKNIKVIKKYISHENNMLTKTIPHEIEDFIPQNLIFDAINKILKRQGYKIITKAQIANKNKEAFLKTQLLEYAETIIKNNNLDKEPLKLTNDGRKLQICEICCELLSLHPEIYALNENQKNFLNEISCENV